MTVYLYMNIYTICNLIPFLVGLGPVPSFPGHWERAPVQAVPGHPRASNKNSMKGVNVHVYT